MSLLLNGPKRKNEIMIMHNEPFYGYWNTVLFTLQAIHYKYCAKILKFWRFDSMIKKCRIKWKLKITNLRRNVYHNVNGNALRIEWAQKFHPLNSFYITIIYLYFRSGIFFEDFRLLKASALLSFSTKPFIFPFS